MRAGVFTLICFISVTAFADQIDELGPALRGDPSYKVRAQAAIVLGNLKDRRGVPLLVGALRDREPAVRIVAASSLGRLGDPSALEGLRASMADVELPVRTAAGKAIAAIEAARDSGQSVGGSSGGSRRIALEVSPTMGSMSDPKLARYAHDKLISHLRLLRNVTLKPEPGAARYFIDTTITKLTAVTFGKGSRVNVECDVSVIIATYPEHSMKMTASVGGFLDEPNDPKGITDAKNFCLDDAAKQAAEKVQTYLKGVR